MKILQAILPKSLKTRLMMVILAATLLPALMVGWVAVDAVSRIVRQNNINDVGLVADNGGCLLVDFGQKEVCTPLAKLKFQVAMLVLLVGVLGVFAAIILGRQFGRQLRRLGDSLSKIADGSIPLNIGAGEPQEITALAVAFNGMLERLNHSYAQLSESEQRSRLLLESVNNGILGLDRQGRLNFINSAAVRMLGYTHEELIGKDMQATVHHSAPDGRTYLKGSCPMDVTLTDGLPHSGLDEVLWRKDGSSFPVEYGAYPLCESGAQIGAVVVFQDITERKQAKRQAQQDRDKLSGLVDSAMDAIISMDEQQNITLFNRAAEQVFGYRAADIIGQPVEKIIPLRFRAEHGQHVAEFGRMGVTARSMNVRGLASGLRANGEEFPFEASISQVEVAGKKIYTAILRDITQRRRDEEALQLAASVYQSSHEGVLVTDENNLIVDTNAAFTELTGFTLDEVRGKNPRMFQSGKHDTDFYREMWQSIDEKGHWQGEVWDRRKDGKLHAKLLNICVLRHPDGSLFRYVGQFSDITEKKRKEELIWTQANYDDLTGLPNRRLLSDRLHHAMTASIRSGQHGALLLFDLDQFKQLNDTQGHGTGDQLLVEVARRLKACVRAEDTVARMGGDEFLVVLGELSRDQNEAAVQAEQVAEKIRNELYLPYALGTIVHHASSSAGLVIFLGNLRSEEELFAHADIAMYQAKAQGRNTSCFYDASMQAVLEKHSQLEKALRGALSREEFTLYYQLQVDTAGSPIGAEALLRWTHPELGSVSPAQFIPVAEETGLILPIGLWVLETACAQLACWQADPRFNRLIIAVNVSARQFREAAFVSQVRNALNNSGIRPEMLKLELTESLVLDNVENSISKMRELKALGIKFSMDDFGTGYSSLSYLSRLPMDQLKIDQSFVRNITTDPNDAAIVQTIIAMAKGLGLHVIAEGVETEQQREFLELRGCQAYQGYLYAKPMPIKDLELKLS